MTAYPTDFNNHRPCFIKARQGFCYRGPLCPFANSHSWDQTVLKNRSKCNSWKPEVGIGSCRRGEGCGFLHLGLDGEDVRSVNSNKKGKSGGQAEGKEKNEKTKEESEKTKTGGSRTNSTPQSKGPDNPKSSKKPASNYDPLWTEPNATKPNFNSSDNDAKRKPPKFSMFAEAPFITNPDGTRTFHYPFCRPLYETGFCRFFEKCRFDHPKTLKAREIWFPADPPFDPRSTSHHSNEKRPPPPPNPRTDSSSSTNTADSNSSFASDGTSKSNTSAPQTPLTEPDESPPFTSTNNTSSKPKSSKATNSTSSLPLNLTETKLINILLISGGAAFAGEAYKQAIHCYDLVWEFDSVREEESKRRLVRYNRGSALWKAGTKTDLERAKLDCEAVLFEAPSNFKYVRLRARIHASMEEYKESEKLFHKAIDLYSSSSLDHREVVSSLGKELIPVLNARARQEAERQREVEKKAKEEQKKEQERAKAEEKKKKDGMRQFQRLRKLDYYELLGVEKNVSTTEIIKAARKAFLKYHPDKCGPHLEEVCKLVGSAKETLTDSFKRSEYNRDLARQNSQDNSESDDEYDTRSNPWDL